jgi:hypothetical protein
VQNYPQYLTIQNQGAITVTDPLLLKSLLAFMLKPGSPCIDKGLNLKASFGIDCGTHDFYGNSIPISLAFDIGAQEFSGANKTLHGMAAPSHDQHALPSGFKIADGKTRAIQSTSMEQQSTALYSLSGILLRSNMAMMGIIEK